ncbi:MAG: helix-turn-helix domain-containing protein [Oscillospiraceae bacterium]|jgi:transcriptional regulator with XRE-family HTH domain|nr:helix-turn-helix domain-containing protein [Oscillospiraceae bacterium]
MDKETLGARLAALRTAQGLSQQQVADRLLISNKTVSKWENGVTSPDLSCIPTLAELFGVSCDALLRGDPLPNESSAPAPQVAPIPTTATENASTLRLAAQTQALYLIFAASGLTLGIVGFVLQILRVTALAVVPCLLFGLLAMFVGTVLATGRYRAAAWENAALLAARTKLRRMIFVLSALYFFLLQLSAWCEGFSHYWFEPFPGVLLAVLVTIIVLPIALRLLRTWLGNEK